RPSNFRSFELVTSKFRDHSLKLATSTPRGNKVIVWISSGINPFSSKVSGVSVPFMKKLCTSIADSDNWLPMSVVFNCLDASVAYW
ncbi:1167_t:CDS:2, partial [Racocetra persica]